MTRKQRRLYVVIAALLGLGTATGLILFALRSQVTLFYSPSDLVARPPGGRHIRIGGLVAPGSVTHPDGSSVTFTVTDMKQTVAVRYSGVVPDLFREGQGVVAEGELGGDGVFTATELLAKHDERYMPPDVADALKRAGHPVAATDQGEHSTDTLSKP